MGSKDVGMPQQAALTQSAEVPENDTSEGKHRNSKPTERVTLLLDADIVSIFRATGRGWQTRINSALRDWLGPPWTV